MLNKYSVCVVSVILCFISGLTSASPAVHPTPTGIHLNYTLHPNQAEEFQNPLYWDAEVVCYLYSDDAELKFEVTLLKNNGKVNGTGVHSGETLNFDSPNGSRFKIEADGQAKMRVINQGLHDMSAKCDV